MNNLILTKLSVNILLIAGLLSSCWSYKFEEQHGQEKKPYNLVQNNYGVDCPPLEQHDCEKKKAFCKWNVDTCEPVMLSALPSLPTKLQAVKQIKADKYVCAIDNKNTLWCLNYFDQYNIYPHPSRHFKEVETQDFRVCGVLIDGNGVCFTKGKEDAGLVFSKKVRKLYPFGEHTCGIYEDGTMFCDGNNRNIAEISNLTSKISGKVTQLVPNSDFRIGVLYEDGHFLGSKFLNNKWLDLPPVTDVLAASTAVSQITAKRPDACLIAKNSQRLFCLGLQYDTGEIKIPDDLKNERFISVSVGANHTCAILERNNEARCWGGKTRGQCHLPNNLTGVKSITAGEQITCYIDSADKAHCIGQGREY